MLTKRQSLILQAVIDYYAKYQSPVGSKALSKHPEINASSATIRNELARLEELSLITKTHASSGRMPAEQGYRYYINHIMPYFGGLIDLGLAEEEESILQDIFNDPYNDLNQVIRKTAATLANLSENVVISIGPDIATQRLAKFHVLSLTEDQAMVILVTDKGVIRNQMVNFNLVLTPALIEGIAEIMNQELVGLELSKVVQRLQTHYLNDIDQMNHSAEDSNHLIHRLMSQFNSDDMFVDGQNYLFSALAETSDGANIPYLSQLLENHAVIASLINTSDHGIQVRVGKELKDQSLEKMSLMSANMGTANSGKIITFAVLGPENMSYIRMAQLFQSISKGMSKYLDNNYKS
jgi:heat-inducible transcriptional repressor